MLGAVPAHGTDVFELFQLLDHLVKARVRDMEAYREFLSEVLMTLPGVRETHTYPVMEEVKNTTVLPV